MQIAQYISEQVNIVERGALSCVKSIAKQKCCREYTLDSLRKRLEAQTLCGK